MTDKILEEKSAGSSTAEVKEDEPKAEINQSEAIQALQAELKNVKDILQSIETQSKQPVTEYPQTLEHEAVRQTITSDFDRIDRLVSLGRLNPQQGTVLKNEVLQKAFGSKNLQQPVQPPNVQASSSEDPFTEFEKSNPDFFSNEARKQVKSYISDGIEAISPEELMKIAEIIKSLESTAITEYEQSKARETAIHETNSEAKKRLASNALTSQKAHGESGKVFTREEIGKMSPDEFRQNESAIMGQLRKGQIK